MWRLVYDWFKCEPVKGINLFEVLENHNKIPLKIDKKLSQVFWHCTIWNLWRARNERIFKDVILTQWQILERIKICRWDWLKSKNELRNYNQLCAWIQEPVSCLSVRT